MDTPHKNSITDTSIANMSNRGRALMNAVNVPNELRFKISREGGISSGNILRWIVSYCIG
jgi:hypothetical protein